VSESNWNQPQEALENKTVKAEDTFNKPNLGQQRK
jgi:hypothetical protein